jgi:hypothetical protein
MKHTPSSIKEILEDYVGKLPIDEVAGVRYSIKIDRREYQVKDTERGPEIQTEIGWLTQDKFLDYLLWNEKMNGIIDLASIGLDRLIGKG